MNSDMRKFLSELIIVSACVFSIILIMFLLGVFVIGCQYEDDYNSALIDKVARLKSINKPKIILVGNSNLAFGMNSGMLEDALNMPVVNLGLHGGLGNAFHENIAKLNINSGDIVIVCHTTYSDDNRIESIALCWITLEYHKDLWEILRPEDYPNMIMAFPKYWHKSLLRFIKRMIMGKYTDNVSSYQRRYFNNYGDVVVKPEKGRSTWSVNFRPSVTKLPEINSICVARLNKFNSYAKERGATVLIAGYPIGDGKYTYPAEEYVKFQEELAERLDCPIISDFRDYFIPYEYFYDGINHLDNKGAEIRTQQLIKDIMKWKEGRKQ